LEATNEGGTTSFLYRLLELSFQSLVVASLGALHQFRVLCNASSWFVNTSGGNHFDRENVSGLELSIFPLEVFADVAIGWSVSGEAEAEIAIPLRLSLLHACPRGAATHPRGQSCEYTVRAHAGPSELLTV
jgi:hypothetical protein